MPADGRKRLRWEGTFELLVRNKLLVFVPLALIVLGGLIVSPFAWDLGSLPRDRVPVDAIPNTGDNQQIIFTEWPGRSPRDIDDQITYPLTTTLLSVPKVKTVRSQSMFGFSSIYVIFEESAGFYWSRERLLERISSLPDGTLPDGVAPRLGPEATALGQIFWYTLEGRDPDGSVTPGWDRDELRSIQDWTVRYALQGVPGVAEVSSVGGFVREYQVDVDPDALAVQGVTLAAVVNAVHHSNMEIGARTLEINRAEYIVRARGFVDSTEDLELAVVAVRDNVPVRVRDVARVTMGPATRRGALDDAGADVVGGVVVARFGENPMEVITAVKERIADIAPTLPVKTLEDGTESRVTIVPFYDRTELIDETLDTLGTALFQQILITVLVVLVLLRHLRSSALISVLLPLAVLATFGAMKVTNVGANVMSLAGIAIAIGTMVDIGIVFVENIVRHLDEAGDDDDPVRTIARATAEVAPAVLTSVATTVVSFLPVFALTAAEGKLFRPLAFTKSYAITASVILAIALVPALAHLMLRRAGRRVAPDGPLWPRLWRAALRPAHLADWATLVGGVVVTGWISPLIGVYLVVAGGLGLARPHLPGRWPRWSLVGEVVAGVLVVGLLLTSDWMPLGVDRSLMANLILVGGSVTVVLGSFVLFQRVYDRALGWALAHKLSFAVLPAFVVVFGLTAWKGFDAVFGWVPTSLRHQGPIVRLAHDLPGFSQEFMPTFDEGSFLVMPTTMPHASFGTSQQLLSDMDAAIAEIPEVDRVVGKLGRADSALDPAPVSMFEAVVTYKPEWGRDADGNRVRNWRDHIQSPDDIWDEIARAAAIPGITPVSKLMPIETRRIMLQTGMRGALGVRLQGPDLDSLAEAGLAVEAALRDVPAIKSETVAAERVVGKPYLEIDIDREAIARFGLNIVDVQQTLAVALGGMPQTRTVEGRERYPVRVRFMREERDSIEALERLILSTPTGQTVPLAQLATIEYVRGPQVIKSEDTFMTSYVTFDRYNRYSEVDVVNMANEHLERLIDSGELELPEGVTFEFAGAYENQVRSAKRLALLIPIALFIVFFLLYLQFKRVTTTLIIYTGVAISVAGSFILIWLYGQPGFLDWSVLGADVRELFGVGPMNMSVAVWVGVIALIGIATDNGVVMATYLDQQMAEGPAESIEDIRARVRAGSARRVRACLMTTATTVLALLPVLTSTGRGSDVMIPMAVPVLGGSFIALITLFVVPVLYSSVEETQWRLAQRNHPTPEEKTT